VNPKPPVPVCKALLVCRRIVEKQGEISLIDITRSHQHHYFPAAVAVGVFGRLTSAHGSYQLQVQLQNEDGEVVWQDGPPKPWPLPDPLMAYDIRFNLCMSFPKPGAYDVVLLANGEELARDRFYTHLLPAPAQK
jgi:hypothetical protein